MFFLSSCVVTGFYCCFNTSVGYPLTVIGGILGKNWANGFDAPCRTKNIAREIPPVAWYRSPLAHCIVGGFLPFRLDFISGSLNDCSRCTSCCFMHLKVKISPIYLAQFVTNRIAKAAI
jgi:hypothetical protein